MADFCNQPLFEALAGGSPLECQSQIWRQKTRIVGHHIVKKHDTGAWQTDRRTRCSRKDRASIASRG